ncbi:MAG: CoA-binding protein [Vampirovibrio sp.]|nr:CoA-binding protein [Vampirovibrio sp.]
MTPNPTQEFPTLKSWAVIGVSADREKYGNKIFRDLLQAGYQVYGVNPKLTEVEGQPCYPSLKDLPVVPEVVNIVVPPIVAENIIDDCVALNIKRIWFQPGSESDAAIQKAEAAGLTVVANACIMIEKHAFAS